VVSVGYLALTRSRLEAVPGVEWRDWYSYFPWEDWREAMPPMISSVIGPRLHGFAEVRPEVDAISVIEPTPTGQLRVLASTSTEEHADVIALAARAIETQAQTNDRTETAVSSAMPVVGRSSQAVVAAVGLESVQQLRAHGISVAFGFALPTLLLVTVLTHFGIRRLVQRPLSAILSSNAAPSTPWLPPVSSE